MLLLGHATVLTTVAAAGYAISRVLFTICYWMALNKARSTMWAIGMVCIACIGWEGIAAA